MPSILSRNMHIEQNIGSDDEFCRASLQPPSVLTPYCKRKLQFKIQNVMRLYLSPSPILELTPSREPFIASILHAGVRRIVTP